MNPLRQTLLSALFFVIPLMASAAPPQPPKIVADAAIRMYFDYDYADPDNAWAPRPKANQTAIFLKKKVLRPVYLSGNAEPDWMIDVEADPQGALCGTGGCPLQIWVKDGDDYRLVMDKQVREWKLHAVQNEKRQWLWVDLHGTACGSFGADECPFAFEWSREGYLMASARYAKASLIHVAALPQAMDNYLSDAPDPPAPLAALIATATEACKSRGGELASEQALANRAPDLNGDGIGDWSFDNGWSYCAFPDSEDFAAKRAEDPCGYLDCRTVLFVSIKAANGTKWRQQDIGKEQYAYRVDPAKGFTPVRLIPLDGHKDNDAEPCGVSTLQFCRIEPIVISPDL
ncbi:hypothetical protein PQU92_01800 [Asticcacaulis sp. BYS171W]|uniref:Uncharacterized protein n=1 Tax=Asticcacaulis aquaticus TaxID=2984212 RepID=A0ABT5HPI8_9CAUL|nr:hypothetical protein [Asticcacaulis aquaticus]MDC7681988.1 hypothetical protein [Asticcacaulis aquaticus]